MKFISLLLTALIAVLSLTACEQQEKKSTTITIGIVVPLQHKAMDEIVDGFTSTLKETFHQPIKFNVANAQNDANLERAIIEQMRDANTTLIVPIGTDATEMTLAKVHNQPVVSLASDFSDAARKKLNPCNVAVVHDEISPAQIIAFIHAAYPDLTRLTLIHSSANKVFPEVATTIAAGKQNGIEIKAVMVSSLPELTTAVAAIPEQSQGIFILKDSLIVSGVGTLAKAATERHIPLITSDQGSAQGGAGFALGVHERAIGVEGAKLAARILNNTPACDLPITDMQNLTVFINQHALKRSLQDTTRVVDAAKKLNYTVEYINQNAG
jgi:putative ABC transport system substrate-binding protein